MAIKRSAKFFGPLLKEPEAEKTASGFFEAAKEVAKTKEFLIPMSMMAIGGAMNLAASGIGSLQEARAKSKAYSGMMEMHPHFKERDEASVRRLYGTLYNLNPTMAKDPMIAGAWIDNVIERQGAFGGAHGTSNQGLLSAVPELAQINASIAGGHRGDKRPVDYIPRALQVGSAISAGVGALDERDRLREERDRAFERAAVDDIHKKTGLPPSKERIIAILSAEKALHENPGVAAAARILEEEGDRELAGGVYRAHTHSPMAPRSASRTEEALGRYLGHFENQGMPPQRSGEGIGPVRRRKPAPPAPPAPSAGGGGPKRRLVG